LVGLRRSTWTVDRTAHLLQTFEVANSNTFELHPLTPGRGARQGRTECWSYCFVIAS
jgi:hypothetical protein